MVLALRPPERENTPARRGVQLANDRHCWWQFRYGASRRIPPRFIRLAPPIASINYFCGVASPPQPLTAEASTDTTDRYIIYSWIGAPPAYGYVAFQRIESLHSSTYNGRYQKYIEEEHSESAYLHQGRWLYPGVVKIPTKNSWIRIVIRISSKICYS